MYILGVHLWPSERKPNSSSQLAGGQLKAGAHPRAGEKGCLADAVNYTVSCVCIYIYIYIHIYICNVICNMTYDVRYDI